MRACVHACAHARVRACVCAGGLHVRAYYMRAACCLPDLFAGEGFCGNNDDEMPETQPERCQ